MPYQKSSKFTGKMFFLTRHQTQKTCNLFHRYGLDGVVVDDVDVDADAGVDAGVDEEDYCDFCCFRIMEN